MKRFFLYIGYMCLICTSAAAQDTLYPVKLPLTGLDSMHVEMDSRQKEHSRFIAEKTFEFKLLVEFPTEDEAGFLPDSDAPIAMFWIRIENLSTRPRDISTSAFTLTDEEGRSYPLLTPEAAFDRLIAQSSGRRNVMSNAVKGISLGKAGITPEELKDETVRFGFQSGQLQAQGIKQGLLFFEEPDRKKFTLTLKLGDLWSRPFVFTNVKPKN